MTFWLFCYYWVSCGIAVLDSRSSLPPLIDFIISLAFGGIIIPARIINGLIKRL